MPAPDIAKPRSYVIQALIVLVFIVFIIRLLYMQIIKDTYKQLAEDRAYRKVTVYPDRGQIFDRNEKLVAYNEPIYNLMVIPGQVKNIDTARFCHVMGIDKNYFIKKMREAKNFSPVHASIFLSQLSGDEFGRIEEYLYEFNGFFPEVRTVRKYPYGTASHLLGYVTEVDSSDIRKSDNYYKSGDYIGKSGVEKSYENLLRGKQGHRHMVVDAYNRIVGVLDDGEGDIAPEAGKNLTLSIDIDLQNYAEQLMANKRGAVVAIEPSTGEVLCLMSSPTYDPNLLVGSKRSRNFAGLTLDPQKPLNNRALTGYYPPGSTFKPVMAALGMDFGSLISDQGYSCPGGYVMSGHTVNCHSHPYAGNVELGIGHSCNTYFCHVFRHFIDAYQSPADGLTAFKEQLAGFGIGIKTGIDLPNERGGNVPDPEDYDKIYGKGRWRSSNCVTLGIGQDQLIVTPLQSANAMATIANKGHYYPPHVLRFADAEDSLLNTFRVIHETGIHDTVFTYIIAGMAGAVNFGTARIARLDSIQVCGKTGTAENPHGKDHSWFSAFAPEQNAEIAIAVVVENSGFGATYAAPIASLLIEKYMNGEISEKRKLLEERILKADLINDPEPPKIPTDSTITVPLVQAALLPNNR